MVKSFWISYISSYDSLFFLILIFYNNIDVFFCLEGCSRIWYEYKVVIYIFMLKFYVLEFLRNWNFLRVERIFVVKWILSLYENLKY